MKLSRKIAYDGHMQGVYWLWHGWISFDPPWIFEHRVEGARTINHRVIIPDRVKYIPR